MFNHEVHEGHEVKKKDFDVEALNFVYFVALKALVVRKVFV